LAVFWSAVLFAASLWAQPAAWDNSPRAAELAQNAARLQPLLDQLTPDQWVAKGASDSYMRQWQSAREELATLSDLAKRLDQNPKKLTLALDTYFSLQNLEWRIDSLIGAVRTYQNPAVGDLIESVLRSNSPYRDSLRAYIKELATLREEEFSIVTNDAQSCRVELAQIPASARRTTSNSSKAKSTK
jgi:hypothetical protein